MEKGEGERKRKKRVNKMKVSLNNELPKEIQDLIIAKGYTSTRVETYADLNYAFVWIDTEEGGDFWARIESGNTERFYEKYPQYSSSFISEGYEEWKKENGYT